MRERITVAFIVLALAVLIGAGIVRAYTLRDILREQSADHLDHTVVLVGGTIGHQIEERRTVDRDYLRMYVPHDARLTYSGPGGQPISVEGDDYTGDPTEDITATYEGNGFDVVLSQESHVIGEIYKRDISALLTLFLLIAMVAGLAGWFAARSLARPFQQLAVAAGALGRGRFDLDLPDTKIPEARQISQSLQTSALQLKGRMARERQFAAHASHELRTPLTALRLELEDLTLRDDVPEDAKAAARRCMLSVDEVTQSASDLVAMASKGSLVEGAEVSLHDLATQLAQRWADRLADERRTLSASAEGDLDLSFTPGPVEHVLDLLLADIVADGKGPVRITFFAEDDYLKVHLPAGVRGDGKGRHPRPGSNGAGLAEATDVVESQGGRVTGDGVHEDIEVLLPRR